MTAVNLTSAVRKLAAAHGFERVGICSAAPTPRADFLDEWLAQGRHGDMGWLERNPHWRKDITTRYPWAKSFVMLGIDYPPELPEKLPAKSVLPNIARYARGPDYHDTYQPPLRELQAAIRKLGGPDAEALAYQDTGPFLERALAQQAGLGWVGKNTMLIDPARGSWSFLALIVTSLELEPDAPGTDHCGTCTRCLEACPTDAFPAPYQLDATRCISYLTIEHKGAIDPALHEGTGEWLFGCDICNEVCPWNSKAPKTRAEPGDELAGLTLAKIFTSKPEHLKKRIAGTPLERTGPARLVRNAAVVAGNLRDPKLLPGLEQAARHEEAFVREAVYHALIRHGIPAARAALARAQRHEAEPTMRDIIVEALQSWPQT
jgi:epoxyqueuosine reductase